MKPQFLKKGDTVTILSTARKVERAAIDHAKKEIEGWGINVLFAEHLFEENHQFAGTDEHRIADFNVALQNPDVKAIICARGGYGTTRIIDKINWDLLKKQPKWICGFSDITAIVCHLSNFNIESIHSTMAALFDEKPGRAESIESLRKLLFGERFEIEANSHVFNRIGYAEGEIIGGNLSILNNIIGTKSDPSYEGKILFMEDLDEYLYHIDRMMVHLDRCGKLEKLAGMVVGQMSDMNDNAIPFGKDALEIIHEHVQKYDFPVAFGFPIGHEPLNLAVPVGRRVKLLVEQNCVILTEK